MITMRTKYIFFKVQRTYWTQLSLVLIHIVLCGFIFFPFLRAAGVLVGKDLWYIGVLKTATASYPVMFISE